MLVYINPGHDIKYDSGATGYGLREADIALAVGKLLKSILEGIGINVMMRQSDNLNNDSSYSDRDVAVCPEANENGADIFVSLHCNAASTTAANGTECLYYPGSANSQLLSQCIQNQIVGSFGTTDRGIKERPNLIVLKSTDMPATLVEMAFISNQSDANLLSNYQYRFAAAIARGITDYMSGKALSVEEVKSQLSNNPSTPAPKAEDTPVAPNGKLYEQNDIDYLVNQGYTKDNAIALLATCDKYKKSEPKATIDTSDPDADIHAFDYSNGTHSIFFSEWELRCHGEGCCSGFPDGGMNPKLLELLDRIRKSVGGPVSISCAYRCPTHNAEVGGVSGSQHKLGTAADVQLPDGYTVDQLADIARICGARGIGKYSWGCHVDVRDEPAEWDDR